MPNDKGTTLNGLKREMKAAAVPERAKTYRWFFKTGQGEYGEGDKFMGIVMPVIRKLSKKYRELPLDDVERLLESPVHEHRLVALRILAEKYERGSEAEKRAVATLYLARLDRVNNWDLVDTSAPYILGDWLISRDRAPLYALAKSASVWKRRVAIVSTFAFVWNGETEDVVKLSEALLKDRHDLIHKAAGWMLREMGKRASHGELVKFLDNHAKEMPRTMLRYSLEHFPPEFRRKYMAR